MYSRPATGQVDALARIPQAGSIDVAGPRRVTRSADGPLLDNRNPNILRQAGEARAAEVTGFIENLTKTAAPIIKDQLTKQANRQVGELLATQDPVQLIRSATPEQRATIRALSPQAQDILQNTAAQASVQLYSETLSAERAKRRAVLDTNNFSAEDRAKADAEAMSNASDAAGLTSLKPEYLAAYADKLGQVNALLQGTSYKARAKDRDESDKLIYQRGIESSLDLYAKARRDAVNSNTVEKYAADLKANFETGINGALVRYTPKELAEIWGQSIRNRVMTLTAKGDYDSAMNFLYTMQGAAELGVQAKNGVDFFGQQLDNGYTLQYTINGLLDQTEEGYKKFQNEQVLEDNKEIIRQGLLGADVKAELGAALADPRLTAEQMLTLGQSATQATNIGQQASPEQQQREAELRYRIAQGSYDPQKMWQEAKAAGLTPQQLLGLAGGITKGADESTRAIAGVRGYLENETMQSVDAIAAASGLSGEAKQTFARNFQNDVTKQVEKRYAAAQQKGEIIDDAKLRDIYRNELEALTKSRIKDRQTLESTLRNSSPKVKAINELQTFQKNLQQTRGQVTIMSYPKEVRVDFQKSFPNRAMTTEALGEYLIQRLNTVKKPSGELEFPEASKTVKQIIDYNKPASKATNILGQVGNTLLNAIPGASLTGSVNNFSMEAVNSLKSWLDKTTAPPTKPASPTGPQSSATQKKPQQPVAQINPVQNMVAQGLSSIANAFTPPAAAATLDAQPRQMATVQNNNQEAIALLSRMWRGQERTGINTPPLPQVNGGTPVGFVPLAITNDMNPLFVAIGISEGTRTASGGYTKAYYGHRDPGNGVWNVGTVSGQQGGSPQGSDRRWMANLTSTAARIAPTLQKMGLQSGTQAFNRIMFNVLDLNVQAPAALGDFIRKLPGVVRQGATVEAIAKARADSFFNPATGRLEAGGFGNSYSRLFQDQRSRAGVWDYRRRI